MKKANPNPSLSQYVINNRYKLKKLLFSSAFSDIFLGEVLDIKPSNQLPLISTKQSPSQLVIVKICSPHLAENLMFIERQLKDFKHKPKRLLRSMLAFEGEKRFLMITEPVAPDLLTIFDIQKHNFSIKTIALIGLNLIRILKDLHSHKVVFCNLTPRKILTSIQTTRLYLSDFKSAFSLRKSNNRFLQNSKPPSYFSKFTSFSLLSGAEPELHDDLESLGYVLAYFFKKGQLFEDKPGNLGKEEYFIKEKRELVPEIFLGPCCPIELLDYFNYFLYLDSNAVINYHYLENIFSRMLKRTGSDSCFDWMTSPIENELKACDLSEDVTFEEENTRFDDYGVVFKGLEGLKLGQKKKTIEISEGKANDSDSTTQEEAFI